MNCLQGVFLFCFLGFHAAVSEKVFYARAGDDVQLNFLHEKDKYIRWFFGGEEIAWSSPLTNKISQNWKSRLSLSFDVLVIKNVTQRDFGVFRCVVKDKFKELSSEDFRLIQLNVAVEPSVLLPGEWLTLSCSVSSQVPAPQIHWINPQGQKVEGGVGGRVQVQAAAVHSGLWTFVVSHGGKEDKGTVKVTVIDLLAPAQTYTSASSRLTVPCSLSPNTSWDDVKSKGIPEVGWTFCPPNLRCDEPGLLSLSLEDRPTWKTLTDTTLRPSPSPGTGDLSLGRKLGREADAGDYECFMKFENDGTLNRTVRVEVLQIIASPGTQLTEGQQLNLTCTTGRPLPSDLRVQWFPPKDASSPSVSPSVPLHPSPPHINIPAVGQAEDGTWRCELRRGEELLTSAVVELRVESVVKISVWMLVTLCAAAVILVLLVVLFVIVQRRRQRKTRRHKRLCHCKNPKPKGFYRS